MDALSAALGSVRMTGAIFLAAEFTAPWGFAAPHVDQSAPVLAPGTERLINYHLVTDGKAWVQIPGEPDLLVKAGEIVIIPHGEAHVFCNGAPETLLDGTTALRKHITGQLSNLRWGGGGEMTKFVCGFLGCERHADRLFLAGLPTAIKIDIRGDATGAWLESSIRHIVAEGKHGEPGREILLSKLAEALFIESLRCYMKALPKDQIGWLAGASDPVVGPALAKLHRSPAAPWTIADLAREIGASRSVLAQRFVRLLGETPLLYLARWRMQLAARKLLTTNATVIEIAANVGYQSEAAFNRAFKREFGTPPARYRNAHAISRHTVNV